MRRTWDVSFIPVWEARSSPLSTKPRRSIHKAPWSPLSRTYTCRIEKNEVVYGVELPNIEVGIASTREGLISPVGREALRIMGIRTAREFCASLAAQVLAGEFNLALEISRERLYSS